MAGEDGEPSVSTILKSSHCCVLFLTTRLEFVPTASGGSVDRQVVGLGQEEGRHHAMGSGRRLGLVSRQTVRRERETTSRGCKDGHAVPSAGWSF